MNIKVVLFLLSMQGKVPDFSRRDVIVQISFVLITVENKLE